MPMAMELGPPDIGEPWQGGYYIGDVNDGGALFHLVLAPKAAGQSSQQWKTAATSSPGTTSTTNGLANSNAMNDASHPAAAWCRALTIGGFADWYLPAQDELNVTYINRAAIVGADAIVVDAAFTWSSTEGGGVSSAWRQRFSDGVQATNAQKTTSLRIRAIRRVAA